MNEEKPRHGGWLAQIIAVVIGGFILYALATSGHAFRHLPPSHKAIAFAIVVVLVEAVVLLVRWTLRRRPRPQPSATGWERVPGTNTPIRRMGR